VDNVGDSEIYFINAVDYLTGVQDLVFYDHPTLVYSDVHGFNYSKSNHHLAVCPNCAEIHICMKQDFNQQNYFSNFNIWYQNQVSFVDPESDLPISVCHHCLQPSSYYHSLNIGYDHCRLCLAYMPSKEDQYGHIHTFVDTNYRIHRICNICANKHWKPDMVCVCGNSVHEVDMIQVKPNYLMPLTSLDNSVLYYKVKDFFASPNNSLSTTDKIRMYITKACKTCVSSAGLFKGSVIEILESNGGSHFGFLNSMTCSAPSLTKELSLVEVYHQKEDIVEPSVLLVVKITNPGYLGYFVDSNDTF
jgi:hypothetical protein